MTGVIVAREHQHAAVLQRTGGIAVLEDITRTVYAGAFAVPYREHAVVLRARVQVDLLRARHGVAARSSFTPGLNTI